MDRDPTELTLDRLAFAEMQPASDVQTQLLGPSSDGGCSSDRLSGLPEGGTEAVARGVLFVAAVLLQLGADNVSESAEQALPPLVAELSCNPRRVDDIQEQDRGEATGRVGARHPAKYRIRP